MPQISPMAGFLNQLVNLNITTFKCKLITFFLTCDSLSDS